MTVQTRDRWGVDGDLRAVAVKAALPSLWISSLYVAARASAYYVLGEGVGMDSHAYWLAGRVPHPYGPAPEQGDAFLYSPLFAQAMRPMALLSWPAFCTIWMLLIAAAYLWLTRPLPVRWRVPVLLLCVPELMIGNIYSFLAVSLVLCQEKPIAASFPALTKITPGGVCFLWFAVRRRWRDLAVGTAGTMVLIAGSVAIDPGLWREWLAFLAEHSGQGGWEYLLRLIAAGIVVAVSALVGRRWPLAFAFYLAMPLAGLGGQTMIAMIAAIRLADADRRNRLD